MHAGSMAVIPIAPSGSVKNKPELCGLLRIISSVVVKDGGTTSIAQMELKSTLFRNLGPPNLL